MEVEVDTKRNQVDTLGTDGDIHVEFTSGQLEMQSQRKASGSVSARQPRPGAGPAWVEWHENAPANAASGRGARVRWPSRCQLPDSGIPRSPAPSPGPSFSAKQSPGPAATAGGKAPGVPASRASSRGAPRGVDSGRCRHPAGEREREARPLAGRASVGQCVRARGAVSARRRAQPPPPNGHVGAQRRRRLLFLILRTGLRGGPPPSASAARPAASAAASSCPASGSAARRPPHPPRPSGPAGSPAPLRRGARSM
ncbi:proline-rich proteoglycan 2-like [Panthera uncia]|uniref:proline-rich proteoglycan 2-like n=1 Tax=Panthera uncia TaxID=29064 RepID=UPI0020FFADE5|nr:proline-rich proteoglycan 2-like [Panthera uncia]